MRIPSLKEIALSIGLIAGTFSFGQKNLPGRFTDWNLPFGKMDTVNTFHDNGLLKETSVYNMKGHLVFAKSFDKEGNYEGFLEKTIDGFDEYRYGAFDLKDYELINTDEGRRRFTKNAYDKNMNLLSSSAFIGDGSWSYNVYHDTNGDGEMDLSGKHIYGREVTFLNKGKNNLPAFEVTYIPNKPNKGSYTKETRKFTSKKSPQGYIILDLVSSEVINKNYKDDLQQMEDKLLEKNIEERIDLDGDGLPDRQVFTYPSNWSQTSKDSSVISFGGTTQYIREFGADLKIIFRSARGFPELIYTDSPGVQKHIFFDGKGEDELFVPPSKYQLNK